MIHVMMCWFYHILCYDWLHFSSLQNKDKSSSKYKSVGQNLNCCISLNCLKYLFHSLRHLEFLILGWTHTCILITKQFPEKFKEFLKPCLQTATQHACPFSSNHMYTFNIKEVLVKKWMWNTLLHSDQEINLAASFIPYFLFNYNLTRITNFQVIYWFKLYNLHYESTQYNIIIINLRALFTKTNFHNSFRLPMQRISKHFRQNIKMFS